MPNDRDSGLSERPGVERTRAAGRSLYRIANESVVAGLAVLVPILVTILVLNAAVGYLVGVLDLLVAGLAQVGIGRSVSRLIVYAVVVVGFGALVLVVGFLTRFQYGELAIGYVDYVIELVPGIGAVYKSFREMGDVMLESEAENFREVKLVEFPHEGSYTMGFLTTRTPRPLQEAADRGDMVTLFLPLAPNPVMGGHLVHVPEERVMDVDMTVEEGIRTVVTSGVATASPATAGGGLDDRQLRGMSGVAGHPFAGDGRDEPTRDPGASPERRRRAYESYFRPDDPTEAARPDHVERHGGRDTIGREEAHPGEVERGDGRIGREEAHPEDVAADHDDQLGRAETDPEDVAADHDDQLGRAETDPEAVANDREDTIGDDADTPGDLEDDA